ncbi:MAG: PASTA domain-containing protein [Gaiellaceae bacterium]
MRTAVAACVLAILATACVIDGTTTPPPRSPLDQSPGAVSIPNVIGLNYHEARANLEELGFVVQVTGLYTTPVVSHTRPAPGRKLDRGSTVMLVVGPG